MDDGNTKELDYKQLRNRMTCTDNNIQAYKGMADDSLDNTKNNPEIDEQFEKSIQKLIQTETNVAKAEYYELRSDIPDNNEQMGYNDYRNSTVKKKKNDNEDDKAHIINGDDVKGDKDKNISATEKNINSTVKKETRHESGKQNKNKKFIITGVLAVVLLAVIAVIIVNNKKNQSYSYNYDKGMQLKDKGQYQKAIEYLSRAYSMNGGSDDIDVMKSLYECYKQSGVSQDAISILKNILSVDKNNSFAITELLNYYQQNKDGESINDIIEKYKTSDNADIFKPYQPETPKPSSEPGRYNESLEIELESVNYDIYYTTDDTKPSLDSKKYTDAIVLEKGNSVIQCMTVNDIGVFSDIVEYRYEVEFKQPDTPQISLASGTYAMGQTVEIENIKEGCNVYYTLDGTMPDTAAAMYTGEVTLPEGNIIFAAVTVDSRGLNSAVVKRNYIIQPEKKYTFDEAKQLLRSRMEQTGLIKSGTDITEDGSTFTFVYQSKIKIDNDIDIYYIRMDIKKYNHTTTQGYYGVGIINGISYKVDCNEGQYTAVEY